MTQTTVPAGVPVDDGALPLAAEFPAASAQDWRALVAGVLRRSAPAATGDPTAALRWHTYDELELLPLYTAEEAPLPAPPPGVAPFVRGSGRTAGGWDVRQRHADPDPVVTSAAIATDLAGGVQSLWLRLGPDGIAVDDLARVLEQVDLAAVPLAMDAGADTLAAAQALRALAQARQVPLRALRGSLGADPIGAQARGGPTADLSLLAELAAHVAQSPELQLATVDASVYHEAGGSDAHELAIATAVGVAYLRALTAAGLDVEKALAALEFRFVVTADQFGSIAKLRAARLVWDRVAELSGAETRSGQRQHATTSTAMLTRSDPWVNLLRSTIGCFAAAIGGAEAVTVSPFDAALGLPDDFARRLARNTQAILEQESSLGRVADAAGGSWYVESRTQALADRAWSLFTAIERAGGALAALDSGFLEEQLAVVREARRADVAHRRAPITGVSEFALLTEETLPRSGGQPSTASGGQGSLPSVRYAEPFEALRDRADAHLGATGGRPRLVLVALGSVAAHSARSGFATNLFAAGGIEAVVVDGGADDLAAVLAEHGTTVACLCPPDISFADQTLQAAKTLKDAGTSLIWLAGRSAEWPEAAAAGVTGHVFAGVDAVAVLARTLDALGVPA